MPAQHSASHGRHLRRNWAVHERVEHLRRVDLLALVDDVWRLAAVAKHGVSNFRGVRGSESAHEETQPDLAFRTCSVA